MANIPLQSISFPGLSDKYTTPVVDNTLTVAGAAADAKKTGDEIGAIKNEFLQFESGFTSIPLELTINPSTRFISQRFNISDYNFPLVFKCSDTAYSFYISFYYESGNPTTTTWQKNSYVLEQSALPSGTIAVGLTGKADDEHALSDAEKGVFSALETWSLVSVVNTVANVEYGKNLYNKDALTEGYLNPDGTIHADNGSGWMVSNFMPCLGEETYVFTFRQTNGSRATTSAFFVTEYDENRTVIKQTNQISHTITTSADAKWFRICNGPSARVDYMVNKGAGVTPYVDFQENTVINDDHITDIDYKNIAPNGISYKNIDSKITDIFAPIDFVEQTISYPNEGYVTHNGVVESYSNVYVSDLIDCRNIDAIHYTGKSFSAGRCVVFYDSKMFAISCVPSADQSGGLVLVDDTIVVPKNAVYMRLGDYSGGTSQAVTVSYSSAFKVMSSGWYDKKWVVVGDSLTEVNSRTTKHYFDYIKDETGINVVNMGISGTGYAKGSDNNYAFYQRIASVPADADVITIFGSFNDLSAGLDLGTWQDSGVTTLGGCINYTINTLLSTYPLANFGIVAPCPWQSTNPGNATAGGTLYCDLLKEICYKRGIPFLDLYHDSLLRPWDATFRELAYSKDDGNGVHPDENGHKLIAPRFRGFLDTLLL